MQRNVIETLLGGVVLATAGFFIYLAYQAADLTSANGYPIVAEFGTTSGLQVGDDVRLSGIKVGQITAQELDPITYSARVVMLIEPDIKLPSDSAARITSSSLLGGNFLELLPGADETDLAAGDVIYDTTDPVSLTDLLGKIVFQGGNAQ